MSLYTCFGPSLKTTLVLFAALEEMDSLERETERERDREKEKETETLGTGLNVQFNCQHVN